MNKKRILSLLLAFCMLISTISIDAVVNAAEPTNVALAENGTNITSNRISSFGEENGLGLDQMIDGNVGNYGITEECGKDDETTLDLTFKQSYLISQVRMRTREKPTSPVDYTLSVWTANGWKEVVQVVDHVQSEDNEWLEHTFSAVACRAVRLSVTEHGKDDKNTYSIYMREFETYGVETTEEIDVPVNLSNIALATNGTTITSNRISSFGEENNISLDKMIDGKSGNYGITEGCGKDDETTLDLTFKQSYLVSQVRMRTRETPTSPVDYTLSVWTTNGWKEVVQVVDHVQSEDNEWLEHTFPAVACRAVRLSVTEHGKDGKNTYSIYMREFEAYGVPSAKIVPVPADPTNVALATNGTTITSNRISSFGEENNISLDKMIDGKSGNYGITEGCGKDEETTLDLTFKQSYLVSEVRMRTRETPTSPVDYTLSVWTTNGWKEVVQVVDHVQSEDNEWLEHTFSAVACRAVRLSVTEHGKDGRNTYSIYMREFEVYGIPTEEVIAEPPVLYNLAYGMQVTSGSVVDWGAPTYGNNLNNLVDNNGGATNYSSTWGPVDYNYEWVQITFDAPVRAYYVQFTPWTSGELKRFPKDFCIEVYNGTEWETVIAKTDYSEEVYMFEFAEPKECSAIRLVATKLDHADSDTNYALLIADMKVFGECANVTLQRPETVGKKGIRSEAAVVLSKGSHNEALKDCCTNGVVNYTSQLVKNPKDEIAIQYLFGRSLYVDSIKFQVHNSDKGKFPADVDIYAFTGEKWEQVLDVTSYTCTETASEHYFAFKGVYCNSLMIVAKNLYELDGAYGMRLRNIQVLGSFEDDACTLLGDGDGDGKLTEMEDCTAFREYIVNQAELSMQYDINMDETGDVRDLVRMKRYFVGN